MHRLESDTIYTSAHQRDLAPNISSVVVSQKIKSELDHQKGHIYGSIDIANEFL